MRRHHDPLGALRPAVVDRVREPVVVRVADGVVPLAVFERERRRGLDHAHDRRALREVHVVLAAVRTDDARDLIREARAEVVDLTVVDVEAVVVPGDQLEREPLADVTLDVGCTTRTRARCRGTTGRRAPSGRPGRAAAIRSSTVPVAVRAPKSPAAVRWISVSAPRRGIASTNVDATRATTQTPVATSAKRRPRRAVPGEPSMLFPPPWSKSVTTERSHSRPGLHPSSR